MFQLVNHEVSITHVNFRKENHGDEKIAAVDITLKFQASNTILDTIDPSLRKAFFRKPGKGEQQDLPIGDNPLTALAMPFLKEQKVAQEYEGCEVTLAPLLGHIEPIFFADTKVKKIAFDPLEGGSIDMSFTVSSRIEEEDDAPLLSAWRRGDVLLTLTPPTAKDEQEDLSEAA